MQGIAENFVGILRTEDRSSVRKLVRTTVLAGVLALVTGLIVDLGVNGRVFGPAFGLVLATIAIGGMAGMLWARSVTLRRWDQSLAKGWNTWMRYSVACARIDEVYRRARGKPAVRSVGGMAAFWAIALFVTLLFLFLPLVDGIPMFNTTVVFMAYGGYLGGRIGHAFAVQRWSRSFLSSVDEMIRAGELGLWGVV